MADDYQKTIEYRMWRWLHDHRKSRIDGPKHHWRFENMTEWYARTRRPDAEIYAETTGAYKHWRILRLRKRRKYKTL